jgi:hypothetical protein
MFKRFSRESSLRKKAKLRWARDKFFPPRNLSYPQDQNFAGYEVLRVKGKTMRIVIMTAITAAALPFMAIGQTTEEPQQTQSQTKETQTTAPAKGKKMRPAQEQSNAQTKAESSTSGQTNTTVKGRAHVNEHQPGMHSTTSETNVNTNHNTTVSKTVNKEEFRTRHSEVFSLGRHPKEFFVQRYGANHFRLIGNSYFVYLDGCWVAVDVDGFTYTQRVICAGDPDFVEVVD